METEGCPAQRCAPPASNLSGRQRDCAGVRAGRWRPFALSVNGMIDASLLFRGAASGGPLARKLAVDTDVVQVLLWAGRCEKELYDRR